MSTARKHLVFLMLWLLPSTGMVGGTRVAWWTPERMPGSARLSLDAVEFVHLPPEPSAGLNAAVEDLVACWPTGLERLDAGSVSSKQTLHLIRDARFEGEGFSIRRNRTEVFLRAGTDNGLSNGVYAICRELLGARWYWAGDLGFERVGEVADKFPDRLWRESPDFVQRTLYPVNSDFARRNGLNRRYSFNHNLARIFNQAVFKENPEVFAEIGGAVRPPRGSAKYDPQPDFTETGAVTLAAEAARAHFEAHPEANSFSLSINDNSLFDEGSETEAWVRGYFRGRPNYTDLVFTFMNRVADRVFDDPAMRQTSTGEDRYLTALAYYWTEQSPSFPIHPRVMPVLTSDRAQWHDPEYRAEDKALIQRWAGSGPERIATWDYYYGAPYPYPRQFTEWIGESIDYLHRAGVDVFFSQLPSVWGLDGPKAWLAAQLLRDAEQKPGKLLDEYYDNFFGPAADPVRKFYEIAEQTRNEEAGTAQWIKFYKDEAGVELFDLRTLEQMRACLESAKASLDPGTPARYHARVDIVSEAFSYTESYAAYHRSRVQLVNQVLAGLRQDPEAVDGNALVRALKTYQAAKASFNRLKERLVEQPMQGGFSHFNRLNQSDPTPLVLGALSRAGFDFKAGERDEPLLSQGLANAGGEAHLVSRGRNVTLTHSGVERRNFLGPEIPVMDAWVMDYRASEGLRVTAASGQEASGLRIEGADIVSLAQHYPVTDGKNYLLEIDASWQVSPDNRTWVQLNWNSLHGDKLRTELPLRLPNGSTSEMQTLPFLVRAPANAYELKVGIVTNRQYEGDYLEVERIDLGELAAE